ncbi:MAG: hypothetical protein L6Q71_08105, partial [Planctomycetes bacterium]|nr:hypothetical protein [Planctomycetota bacterium]
MTTIVTATLNGRPCIEAELHHRAGAKPSTATVIMRADDGEQVARGPATLVLGDGASRVEFTSLDVTSVQTDAGIARVILADRRRGWNARVSGERKDKTLGQLVAELTKSLGERSGIANLARASETAAAQRWDDALASNAIEALLAQFGQSLVVAPDGTLAAVSNDAISLDDLPVISCEVAEVTTPGVRVMAPRVLQEAEITGEWEPVCEDESGALRPLAELLTAWGISDADVRKACLFDGGLRKLVGDATKAALLERFAYRCYRIPEAERDKLPLVAKRLNADNKLIAERVEHTGFRLKGRDVPALDDPYETQTPLTPAAGYVFDGVAGTVLFDHVVGHLEPARPPVHDTRLEGRTLKEAPEIKLTASYRSGPALEVLRRNGEGNGDIQVYRGELQGLRKANQTSSTPVNQTKLANDAAFVHERFLRALPTQKLSAKIAGAYTVGPAPYGEVLIRCNDSDGLITEIIPPHDPVRLLADAFATPPDALPSVSAAIGEEPPVTKHANAYHTGPLVLRVDRGVNESEAFIAARAKKVDPKDGHLTLDQLGPLREPFHLPNIAATKAGGWFLAAPIRVTDDGVRLLSDSETIAKDFDAIDTQSLGEGKVPHGTDGLLLQGLDGETYLALYDRPLVAQHRGNDVADYSVEVREIDGDELDAIKRGGTHFPLVVSLSYSHMQAGVGGTQASPGWAPTLNFKDYQTGTKRDFQLAGRGLFTEQRGLHLGRLAHLPLQGGPVMADAARCTKHRYGVAAGPDGMYYESAGHISTEAFFKVPGDETFDAPFSFSKELTSVGAGQGVEFQAEIKLHAEMQHAWNKRTVPHRWVITYRWPVYDSVPPVWTPREDPPYVMEKNLAAPSCDFVPPPSTGEPPYAIPMPEPTINMTGYAPELKPGVPDPSLGGGCVYFPSDVHLKDGAPWASGGPTRYVVLHPKVGLGFGLPSLSGDGGSVSGVRMGLDGNDALFIQPVDASGNPAPGKATTIKGPLALDSVPTP